ncbi:protein unc-13 homolog 4B [Trichonephila clavipes]|nr:protein unc-13 homolog 4B [Trichonephila clavipes]
MVAFLDNYVKHSTSAVDAATCFVQIKEFWRQLSWPDPAGAFTFVMKVIEIICEGTIYYAKLCQQKLQKITDADPQNDVTEKLCITINNMEYVLQTLRPLEDDLGVEQIIKTLNLNQGGCTANQCRESIYDLINKSEDDVTGKIFSIICGMVEKKNLYVQEALAVFEELPSDDDSAAFNNSETDVEGYVKNVAQGENISSSEEEINEIQSPSTS